jgi:hypothetical protein
MMYSLCQHVALNISKPGHGMDMSLIQQQLLSLAIILQRNVSDYTHTEVKLLSQQKFVQHQRNATNDCCIPKF